MSTAVSLALLILAVAWATWSLRRIKRIHGTVWVPDSEIVRKGKLIVAPRDSPGGADYWRRLFDGLLDLLKLLAGLGALILAVSLCLGLVYLIVQFIKWCWFH